MRVAVVVAFLLAAGCLGLGPRDDPGRTVSPPDVGYDAQMVSVEGFRVDNVTIASFDATDLSLSAYVPEGVPGASPKWPVVVFVHGWGGSKEDFQGKSARQQVTGVALGESANRLRDYALAGFLAVAYDTRGFGESGGLSTIAGDAEERDLRAILDYTLSTYPTNGRVAIVGGSYGGGHAYLGWARDARVTTAVAHYGWIDLAHGLMPGGVPKLAWGEFLYAYGLPGSQGSYAPIVHEWFRKANLREDMEGVRAEMDARSTRDALVDTHKPLYVCQGMQESLFPQADLAWTMAGGFTRAYIYTGGHGSADPHCWDQTMAWLRFFLLGIDTKVDEWPALESVDASGAAAVGYSEFPANVPRTYYLRDPDLTNLPTATSFTVSQRVVANPIQEPQALWDQSGMPTNLIPNQLREDPAAFFFTSPPAQTSEVLLGAALLHLRLATNATMPYQVVGTLYLESGSSSRMLARAAAAVLDPDTAGDTVTMRFDWTKANVAAGDRVVLKLAANDETAFMPLPATYDVTFTGASWLELPYFEG